MLKNILGKKNTETKADDTEKKPAVKRTAIKIKQPVIISREAKAMPYEPEGYVGQEKKQFTVVTREDEIRAAIVSGTILQGPVTMIEGDKVYVQIGNIMGVIPESEYDANYKFKNLATQIWRPISFVVKAYDKDLNLAVCSRKEAQIKKATPTLDSLTEGDVVSGCVTNIAERAAYLDVGGIDAILPLKQMHHSKPAHPSEMIDKGDYFDVVVLVVDKKRKRVIVGLKQLLDSPWDTVANRYKVGNFKGGIVRSITSDGLFVELEPGLVALAPLAWKDYQVGDYVTAEIKKIEPERHRIKVLVQAKSNWGPGNYGYHGLAGK